MSPNFLIWLSGNLVLPALPVISVYLAQRVARVQPTVQSVLRDGILFFYVVGVAAIFLMDLWKASISPTDGVIDPAASTALMVTCLFIMFLATGAYFFMALANTGVLDKDKDKFDLADLAAWSWQSALVVAIFTGVARLMLGVY